MEVHSALLERRSIQMATRVHRPLLAGLAALLAAVSFSVIAAPRAEASHSVDAELLCNDVTGFTIALSSAGSPRKSAFYWTVDGRNGEWSDWYYTDRYLWWVYDGGWQFLNNGSDPLARSFVDRGVIHTVEAWEWRVSALEPKGGWHYLGWCQASTAGYGNGIYFA
jgi:hypothetical protein